MSVKEERKVEVRCDRCNALIDTITNTSTGDDGEVGNDLPTPDLQVIRDGKVVMEYADLCTKCKAVVESGLDRMGKIDRGNRKPRKKSEKKSVDIGTNTEKDAKVVSKAKKK